MNHRPLTAATVTTRPLVYLTTIGIIAAVYFGSAKLGLSMALTAKQVTLVWPATGIALAAVLVFGYRVWPAVTIGAFLANVTTMHETPFTAGSIAIGNTLEAVVGAWLLHRAGFRYSLERIKDVLALVALAAMTSTTVSATIGVTWLCLEGLHPWDDFTSLWWVWWLGDAIGDLLVAPLLLVCNSRPKMNWSSVRIAEAVAILVTVVVVSLTIFVGYGLPLRDQPLTMKYLIFPFVIWSALRFGPLGTTIVSLVASGIAIWGLKANSGLVNDIWNDESLAILQSFMGVVAATGLLTAAAMGERNAAERHRAVGYQTTRILAESTSLSEATPRLISTICENLGWDVGAVWRVDRLTNQLRCVDVWHRPSVVVTEFVAITRRLTFEQGKGMLGRVWSTGGPLAIPDVTCDPTFVRAAVAAKENLHGALGFPIRLRDQTLGVIEFFSREIQEADASLLQSMAQLGGQIGQFIERKEGEQALLTAQAQLQLVTNTMAAGVTRCSKDGRYLWVSQGYAEWLGRSVEEIVGRTIPEVLGEAAYDAIRPHHRRVLTGQRVEFESQMEIKGSGQRWVSAAYVPTFDVVGQPDGWVAVVSDVTEPKETEQALRDSEERSRSMVDHVVDGIITIDHHGTVASFNPAAEKLFGYPASEVIERNINLLMPEPYHSEHDGYIDSYLRTGLAKIIGIGREVIGRRKDGSVFPMDLSVSEFQQGGRRFFTGIVRDITARKQAEESLRDADRRKDEFLAMLAHELRNPLAAISYASQILDRNVAADSQTARLGGLISRQTQNLSRMVDDLLDVSRITRGKINLTQEPLDIGLVVERAVDNVRPLMQSKQQQLLVRVDSQPLRVNGDATRLEQVLVNLLNNAAKFTNSGGQVILTVERASAGPDDASDQIEFRVADDGVGIPSEMLPSIFNLFMQVDKSLDRSQGGLGIGLSLVQNLVKLHGGTVAAWSAGPGRGSEFTVRLPALPESQPVATPLSSDARTPSRRARVLVVDDNADVAASISLVLGDLGHDAQSVHSGQAALEAAHATPPDLILIDIGMPEMDGYELARRFRTDPNLQETPLVAVSGYGQEEDIRRAEEAGFNAHLVKPVGLSMLEAVLTAATAPAGQFGEVMGANGSNIRGTRFFTRGRVESSSEVTRR